MPHRSSVADIIWRLDASAVELRLRTDAALRRDIDRILRMDSLLDV